MIYGKCHEMTANEPNIGKAPKEGPVRHDLIDRRGLIKGAGFGTIAAVSGGLVAQPAAAQSPVPGPACR